MSYFVVRSYPKFSLVNTEKIEAIDFGCGSDRRDSQTYQKYLVNVEYGHLCCKLYKNRIK